MTNARTPATCSAPARRRCRLGKEIYERDIRPQVEADHFGEYVAIDVETGDWAVADTEIAAMERLRALRPRPLTS